MQEEDFVRILTEPENSLVKQYKALLKTEDIEVDFKVDPSILGGLVVRVGDKVLDGSVAGKLEGMRQAVK